MNAIAAIAARRSSHPLPPLPALDEALERVARTFHNQIASDLPRVDALCRYVERYRGKMLRPTLVLLSGLAGGTRQSPDRPFPDSLITLAAVIEMIHIATLVHDDVLDEAATRRGAATLNRLQGNEVAVIFGDYLISQSFHLCSTLDSQKIALRIGEITSTVCEGEMLQLASRGDPTLDEQTYFAIIERKTAALIAVACELGALLAGAPLDVVERFRSYGMALGSAFQIQDDLLDFVGEQSVVGKDLGKDLEKGKVTLPVLHFLANTTGPARDEVVRLVTLDRPLSVEERRHVATVLREAGSIDHARGVAAGLIERASADLAGLPDSPARTHLLAIAEAVITRDH
jgi:octaprenyl-diphosphate synthase